MLRHTEQGSWAVVEEYLTTQTPKFNFKSFDKEMHERFLSELARRNHYKILAFPHIKTLTINGKIISFTVGCKYA